MKFDQKYNKSLFNKKSPLQKQKGIYIFRRLFLDYEEIVDE